MPKMLQDGENRVIRKSTPFQVPFTVRAIREDCDTPLIELKFEGYPTPITLTDIDADELILQLRKALVILPTSK